MMIYWTWFLVLLSALVVILYRVYTRFSRHDVNTHSMPLPFVGNMFKTLTRLHHFTDMIERIYKSNPEDRFVGHFEFLSPLVVLKDLDLIKQVTVKDFDNFLDHRINVNADHEPFFGKAMFSMRGQKWKDMRSTMSPAFTSSKIRLMVPFMVDVGDQMIDTLKKKIKDGGTGYLDVDIKDISSRYANDVIASCAFGLKVNSLVDENNQFYAMGKVASTFTFIQLLKFLGYSSMPTLMNVLRINFFTEEVRDFFRNLVTDTMKNREEHNIIRPDMIHLLMEAKKGTLVHENDVQDKGDTGFATVEESAVGKTAIKRVWSDDDLIAQAVIFFVAGFDSVATTMAFLLYELALNPEVQDRLAEEIREMDRKNGGFDYTSIQEMKYLDMVVSETLRKWPLAIIMDRIVTKTYNLGKPNKEASEDYIIHKGEGVMIPVWAIHRNPEYYENPEKFDPERFSDENKHNIKPFSYIPFGTGPRNCIGSRFALCEVKVMVYQLIQHMKVSPSTKTCIPAQLATNSFNLRLKGGHWLRISSRD